MVLYSIATAALHFLLGELAHLLEAVISEVPKLRVSTRGPVMVLVAIRSLSCVDMI